MVKVSVIIPVYNAETYLNECIDSLINQTLKEIEIICVNDGSVDRSIEIMKEYISKDSRVTLIDKQNEGYGKAVNVGIDSAKGKYIGIVEPDDFVSLDMYEKLYMKAEIYDLEVVKGNFAEFSGSGREREFIEKNIIDNLEVYEKIIIPSSVDELFRGYIINPGGIYKKDYLDYHGIRHNETPGAAYQDQGFWFQIMQTARRYMLLRDTVYYYRQDNPNSSINDKSKVYCICEEYKFIEKKLNKDFKKQYLCCFINNYLGTYERIKENFKLEFLKRFSEDLRYLKECGLADTKFLNEDEKSKFVKISGDYIQFYNDARKLSNYIHTQIEYFSSVLVYGAGYLGKRIISTMYPEDIKKVTSFVVSDTKENESKIMGIDVKLITDFVAVKNSAAVIIAVTSKYYKEIFERITKEGFQNIISIPKDLL